jgi:hypothetical protein
MARIQDIDLPHLEFAEGAAPAAGAAAITRIYAKADGLMYSKDDAGVETLMSGGAGGGSVATDAIWDAAGDIVQGTGANTAARLAIGTAGQVLRVNSGATATEWGAASTGHVVITYGPDFSLSSGDTINTTSLGIAYPMWVPGPMRIRAATFRVTVTGSGTHEWGLFDYSSNAAACTKLAGGSGALGSTGWTDIAASGAPVTIAAGAYMFIFKFPAANAATIGSNASGVANRTVKSISAYTWDDTPDLTTSWADFTEIPTMYLRGDLNASATW